MLNDVIAVTNRKLSQRPFLEQIKRVCHLRPEAIILREKDLKYSELEKLYNEIVSELKENKADINIIVNS